MRKQKGEKNIPQLIVTALMSGETLRASVISERISEAAGRRIKVQDFSGLLSKISDKSKCDLGYFVKRSRKNNRYVYNIAPEALKLSEEQAYGLTLKMGKDKYSLDEAIVQYPELGKYVKVARKKGKPGRPPKAVSLVKDKAMSTEVGAVAEKGVEKLAPLFIKKIAENGELNVNVKVTFSFK